MRKHNCWNKATSPAELVHKQIGDAIRDRLRKLDTELDLLIEQVRGIFDDRGLRQSQKEERLQTEREAVEALKNLAKLAEKAGRVTSGHNLGADEVLARHIRSCAC